MVDAALEGLGVHVADHGHRNTEVKSNASLASIRTAYLDLYRISKVTRYDAEPDIWIPERYLTITDLVEHLLKPIENGVGPLINKHVKFETLKMQD